MLRNDCIVYNVNFGINVWDRDSCLHPKMLIVILVLKTQPGIQGNRPKSDGP